MQNQYLFSSAIYGKWRQEARALKRSTNLTHHESLEQIAKSKGFANWHQVSSEAKINRASETSFRSGLIVAYDIKDAMDSWVPHDSFVDDSRALYFCEKDIFAWYSRNEEEAEEEEKTATPIDPDEYQEEFNEWLFNVHFFRYVGADLPVSPTKALPLLSDRCFFGPMFFWLNGRFIDPWHDLAVDNFLDMSGNTEPEASKGSRPGGS